MKIVGIIGGSGFIGSYLTKKFLTEKYFTPEFTEENYCVRVSATDISKTEKYLHLLSFPNAKNLEIIPLDLCEQTDLLAFITGCDILIHCGTPFQPDSADSPAGLFEPTIKVTENLLNTACSTLHIAKLIFVSPLSDQNISFLPTEVGRTDYQVPSQGTFQRLTDNDPGFLLSKYQTDQAIKKYINEHRDIKTEIITLSTGLVAGTTLSARPDSTYIGIESLIKNYIAPYSNIKRPFEQNLSLGIVDVNEVTEGIYKAAIIPDLHGKHYHLSGESWRISDIWLMLNNQPPLGVGSKTESRKLVMKDLNMDFKPTIVSLREHASISENQFQE